MPASANSPTWRATVHRPLSGRVTLRPVAGVLECAVMTSQKHAHVPVHIPTLRHPVVIEHVRRRQRDLQLRIADKITSFAGSMRFVYIHAVIFALWCGTGLFGADPYPFNFLTMTVSLEAIFLSTFVMIGQNRQSEFAQAKAEHDFVSQEEQLRTNTELTRKIHELTTEIHREICEKP
jgi:uncharacterized membrane protein